MDRSLRAGLILIAGVALLAAALAIRAIMVETGAWTAALAVAGAALCAWGGFGLRAELGAMVRRRRETAGDRVRSRPMAAKRKT